MALTDEGSSMVMPVAPAYGGGAGFDSFGGNGWWIILLFILLGGWGNNYGGGFGGGDLYPWLNNSQNINGGFRDQMLNTSINGIQSSITSGFGDIQTALCSGFAGVNAGIANGFAQAEISENARQMASMQQMFGVQSALQQCCCDNRAGLADVKYTIATEACADRAAVSQGIQTVLDKLCALELDSYKREADNLRQQLNMAQLAASQVDQTAQIRAAQATTANQLVNELRSCPIPAQPVYGNTPIFSCQSNGCGCGCGGNGFAN